MATNDIIWDWDITNNKVLRSEGFIRYGYNHSSLEDNAASWTDMIHPDDRDHVVESNVNALQDAGTTHWEGSYRCRKSDGNYAYVIDKGCIIRDEEGKAVRMVGAMKDITEQKNQEDALRLANERFELVAKATSDALWDWDILTDTCYFSDGFTALFGHENKADLVYKNWINNIHEAEKSYILESLTEALNNAAINQWQREYRFYRLDKTIAYVLDRGFVIRDDNGRAVRMVGSMQDITNQRETAAEMKKLSLVAKETANVVIITDAQERITWVNKAFTDSTEYSFEEALGKKPGELLQGPKTSQRTKKYLHKCVEMRLPFHCEIINYTKSGKEYWVEVKGQPLFDEKGELQQFFAIQTDITNRKEAEAGMRLSEERYRLLFYNSPQPKWTFHGETLKVVDVNNAAVALYGYSKQEFLGLTITDLKLPEEKGELLSAVEELKNQRNGAFQALVRHKKKNGEAFYIDVSSFSIQLATGTHIMVTGTDMTEKLHLQQQLIAEKVGAQKQVARAIIHAQETERSEIGKELHDNVCQLLTTSKLYMENIKHMPAQREEFIAKGIELVMKSINEIRYLSRQLVSPVSNELGFESSVEELINHYRSMNLFEIRFTYAATIDLVDKDLKTSIIRILQEQFNNTVKYARASAVDLCISNTDDILQVRFEDNGVGFDPDVKKGIGLMNIKNRASAYAGKVKLRTAPGEGCCMEVVFPLTQQAEHLC
jgi:PAS domain S-box-containing protein